MRSDAWRYTIYVAWDGKALRPRWGEVWAEELYDHSADDGSSFDGQYSEPVNLLGRQVGGSVDPKIRTEADRLKAVALQHFSSDF